MGNADLHMHTISSDGATDVQTLLDFVATERPRLDVIAITDHDTLDSSLWAYERREQYSFDIVPGVEVTSSDGHILALWVTTPIPRKLDLLETATAIHEAGGISVLAHPFHWHLDFVWRNAKRYLQTPEVLLQAGITALEVHNAGVATPTSNWLARRMGKKLGIPVVGNSDAHTLGAIGSGYTRFQGTSAEDLRRSIEATETIAKGRPWPITDYFEYLATQRKRKSNPSSVTTY